MSKTDPFLVHRANSREARSTNLFTETEALAARRKVLGLRVLFFGSIALVVALALSLLPAIVWVHVGWILFGILCLVVGMAHIAGFSYLCVEYGKDVEKYKKAKRNGVVEDE